MSKININNLSFSFGDNILFDRLSISVDTSWKLGLIGRNGRGKTTLLRLICGDYEYSGTIDSPMSFTYFPYDITDMEKMTIDAFYELVPSLEKWRLLKEMSLLNIDEGAMYMPFSSLSPGQQTKLQLALMFSYENTFLLIDEPTNHLDIDGRKVVAEYLSKKQGFIVISHDRSFLDTCIDHVLAINKGSIELHKGNYSSWQREFDRCQSREHTENTRLKNEILRLSESAQKKQQWSNAAEKTKFNTKNSGLKQDRGYVGHKAAKMAKRSKSAIRRIEHDIDERQKLLKNYETAPDLSIPPQNCPFKHLVIIEGLSFAYNDKTIVNGFNFCLSPGERIALCGCNGCGKSTLLKLIAGELSPAEGKITKPRALRISFLSQDVLSLYGSLNEYIKNMGCDLTMFKTILRKLGFDRRIFDVPLNSMSMGQRKKAAIAASLCSNAHLYLWDEPLNYLDIMSRIQLEQLIMSCHPSMIMVEHDETFIRNAATRIVTL